jgi:hypothetical protein
MVRVCTPILNLLILVVGVCFGPSCMSWNPSKGYQYYGESGQDTNIQIIRVITKLPNSEQSYKGKVKTHKYINKLQYSYIIYIRVLWTIVVAKYN